MKVQSLKNILLVSFCTVFLAACSSTSKDDGTSTGTGGLNTGNDVATGSVGDGSVSGSSLNGDANADTVFYFDFDQAILKPESRAALRTHAARLAANPSNVRLVGHADERGTREYNMALGERRAKAVRDFLVLNGVSSSNLEAISYGEERPAVAMSNESAWAQNRRVEMK
ncbi:MAG: peptidoglycan-associated lipoprotein Pal [Porticoccaceae bacterium]